MASLSQWTWVWAGSGRWWRTGRPSVLQSMGSQRVIWTRLSDWTTKQHPQLYIKFLLKQFFFLFRITLISTKDKLRLIYLQNKFSLIKLGLIIYISPARIAIDQISSFESALLEFFIWNFQTEVFKCLSRPGNQAKNLPSGLPARHHALFPRGFMAP